MYGGLLRPRSCRRSDNGGSGGRLDLGLFGSSSGRRLRGSRRLSSRVLEGSDGGGLLDLRGVLLDLGRGVVLSLGLGLEEVANARRQTTADLRGLLLLLLLFLLLLLRSLSLSSGLGRCGFGGGCLSRGGLGLLHGLSSRSLLSLGGLSGRLSCGLLGSLLSGGGGSLFLLLGLLVGLLLRLLVRLLLLLTLEGSEELGKERGALGTLLLLGLGGSLSRLGLLGRSSLGGGSLSSGGGISGGSLSLGRGGSRLSLGLLLGGLSSRRLSRRLGSGSRLSGGSLDRLGLLDGGSRGSDGLRHYGRLRGS
ncbi:hypothetical protein C8Q78DRAFT_1022694 [Trametes maxima]|nr:hypothetical protein C8Q78DRAFT_1022694 [Trametes maxima]